MNQPKGKMSKGIIVSIALIGVLMTGGFTSESLKNDSSLFKTSKAEPNFHPYFDDDIREGSFEEEFSTACYSKIYMSVGSSTEGCRVKVLPSHIGVGLNGGNFDLRLETKV